MNYRLDESQCEAVESDERATIVVAGAGSGKTEVVARKIERVIGSSPSDRFRVLALTYTTKAADELVDRLRGTSVDRARVEAKTIHAFAHDLIRQHGTWEDLPPEPEVLARDEDRVDLLVQWLAGSGVRLDPDRASGILREIDLARARLDTAECLAEYVSALANRRALDYPAMLDVATRLLSREWLRSQLIASYRYLIVDEAQNLTAAQYEFIAALLGPPPPQIKALLVGDEKQSIVRFAGADPRLMRRFEREYGARRIELSRNYRSAAAIADLAGSAAGRLGEARVASAVSAARGEVEVRELADEQAEAASVADWVERITSGGLPTDSVAPGESVSVRLDQIAVISRSAAGLRLTADQLGRRGIEFQSASDAKDWMASDLGRAFAAIVEYRAGPNHPSAKRHIEAVAGVRVDRLSSSDLDGLSSLVGVPGEAGPAALVEQLPETTAGPGGDEWPSDRSLILDTWNSFCERVGKHERTYANFHLHVSRTQRGDSQTTGVRLLTVHKAQGREFKAVAIVGLNDGQFPDFRATTPSDQRSELHCFYVAVTRASRVLLLTRSRQRVGRNGPWETRRSEFLDLALRV